MANRLRVVVAIRHAPMRLAVVAALALHGVAAVVASVDSVEAAVCAAWRERPVAVVLDLTLLEGPPARSMAKVSRALNRIPILIVGVETHGGFERRAVSEGAAAYVALDQPIERLAEALERAAASGSRGPAD
jgi:DNA-binding NarL/FixJ family response regulator